jgi:hypothetical protein
MMLLGTVIDTEALLETALAALVAGVGVALTFSLAILGFARFAEATRHQHRAQAVGFAALGLFGFAATAAAIIAGIVAMTSG